MSTIRRWFACLLLVASCSQSRDQTPRSAPTPAPERLDKSAAGSPFDASGPAVDATHAVKCEGVPDTTAELSRACFEGDVSTVRARLATASANDRPNPCQLTPFGEALAPHIAEPGTPPAQEKSRALHKLEVAHLLLDKGIDVRAADRYGSTALHHAAGAYYSEREVVRLVRRVLALGPDVNAQTTGGVTALLLATDKGQIGVVRLLLEAGANPSRGTARGATPMSVAVEHGFGEIQRLLEAHPVARGQNRAPPHTGDGGTR